LEAVLDLALVLRESKRAKEGVRLATCKNKAYNGLKMEPKIDTIILIVDDEIGITRLAKRLLTRAGYQVVVVNRPQDAVEYLDRETVDLMLVDIRMPEIDGFRLMEISREIQPEIAVVIMTGYGTVEAAVESLRKGADGMVLKPFTGVELVQSVEQALREKQSQREIQRLRVLRPLFDITETLFSEIDPERLKQLILDVSCDYLDCTNITIYRHQNDEFNLIVGQGVAFDNQMTAIFDQVVSTHEPLILNADQRNGSKNAAFLAANELRSLVCVPNTSSRGLSILVAGRKLDEQGFSTVDLEMLFLFSRQAAVALENAQLYHELQDHVYQVEKSQQALIQAEKMATAGRLTASIAHEINNPLQSVQNCLHIIKHSNLSAPELDTYLGLVSEELERLVSATKRMLGYCRPGALHHHPTAVNTMIENALKLIEKQILRQNISITKEFDPDLPAVMAVENQLQQVVFNIVLSAMEAMPRGGDLIIQTGQVDNQVIIRIGDTGPGIPADKKESIFEPFASTKEEELGLLTVSYGIVTAHGGTLELMPHQEIGSRFQISLPVGG